MYVSGWGTQNSRALMRHEVVLTLDFSQSAPRDGRWDFRVTLQFQRQDGENVFLDLDDDEALRLLREMEQFRRFRAEELGLDNPEPREDAGQDEDVVQVAPPKVKRKWGTKAHERARQRLMTGEPEKRVKSDWREDYRNETGLLPDATDTGEQALWEGGVKSKVRRMRKLAQRREG